LSGVRPPEKPITEFSASLDPQRTNAEELGGGNRNEICARMPESKQSLERHLSDQHQLLVEQEIPVRGHERPAVPSFPRRTGKALP
jgi:hypothetical protein